MTQPFTCESRAALLANMVEIAREAGALIMTHYAGNIEHRHKADKSPVTLADEQAEHLIVARLNAIAPEIPKTRSASGAAPPDGPRSSHGPRAQGSIPSLSPCRPGSGPS